MEAMPPAPPATVSVIIVTFNTRALTFAAIRSVLESKDGLTKQIIVVDNASTDDTAAALPREFPEVIYLRSERNLGFAGANNLGARSANSEFLLLLNSDARLQPDSLRLAMDWMRAQPDCGIAGAQLLNPDGSRQNSIANFPSLATELLNKSLLRRLFPKRFPGKEQHFEQPTEVESVIGAFMLVRESVWRAIGGMDEGYFFFFEETDFCLQARQRGWRIFHLPQVKVWHEQGKSAGQVHVPARVEYWRSRYLYFSRHHSPVARAVLRLGLGARLFANWISSGLLRVLVRSNRWRNAWQVNNALFLWHLKFCPAEPRLPR
jgi:GT2 family glycosyltransferase